MGKNCDISEPSTSSKGQMKNLRADKWRRIQPSKKRKGACCYDRYHATILEKGERLLRCVVNINMNMVRAGVVDHPRDWVHGGYVEIQNTRWKLYPHWFLKAMSPGRIQRFERFQKAHLKWVNAALTYYNHLVKRAIWILGKMKSSPVSLTVGKTQIDLFYSYKYKGRRN